MSLAAIESLIGSTKTATGPRVRSEPLSWQQTNGPFGRGRVYSLFAASNNDLLVGTDESIFRFSEATGWKEISSTLPDSSAVRALLVTESGRLFAGFEGDGLYRSSDDGESWTKLTAGLPVSRIYTLAVTPEGVILAGAGAGGSYRSMDDGDNWSALGLGQLNAFTVTAAEGLIAGTYWSLFRSTSSGANWTETGTGLPEVPGVRALAVDGDNIFVGTETAGVFRSTDNGNTWIPTGLSKPVTSVAVNPGFVFAVTYDIEDGSGDVYRSADYGESWEKVAAGLPENAEIDVLVVDPDGAVLVGTQGVFRSTDRGETWEQFGVPDSFIIGLGVNPTGTVFVREGNRGVFRSSDMGNTWVQTGINHDPYDLYLNALALNAAGHIFYGTEQSGAWRSTDNGENWTKLDTLFEDQTPWFIAVHHSQDVYVATSGGVVRSTNNGDSWIQSSLRNFVTSLAINTQGHIFAGGAGVFRSVDNGVSWTETGLQGVTVWALTADSEGDVFAGLADGVRMSTDQGDSWTAVIPGMPDVIVTALVVDADDNLLAGTWGRGVFQLDRANHNWNPVNSWLTNKRVRSLSIGPDGTVYVGTGGGGVFRSSQGEGISEAADVVGDFDGSGRVDFGDFFLFADNFGTAEGDDIYEAVYDLNRSGAVDFDDFFLFADNFGKDGGAER